MIAIPPDTKTKIALLGVPFDDNSSFLKGAAEGPARIREALFSDSSNLWTENGYDLGADSVLFDAGDVNERSGFDEIEPAISLLLQHSMVPIALGGDHSITYPILKAVRGHYSKISILHFDAHPDLYHSFQDNPFSHASPFARIMELGLADRLVQIGIRTLNSHQREQAEKFGVTIVEMKDWDERKIPKFETPVYISFDMDALDPSCAPGVSHPEGGGFTTRQAVHVIQSFQAPIAGADIVEYNPRKDVASITAAACSKILKEIAGKILEQT